MNARIRRLFLCSHAILLGCVHASPQQATQGDLAKEHPPGHGHGHAHVHHRFDDAQKWAERFDDPSRDTWQKPDEVIRSLGLPPTAHVADIGSATGYFAVRLARAVPAGRVYGVDIEPDMVRYLAERARKEGLRNVESVHGAAADPNLPAPVDLVLVVDTYHHIADRVAYFAALRSKLRPGGRVAIVDFKLGSPIGPPDEAKLAPEKVIQELTQAGYALQEDPAFLPHQYFLVFGVRPAPKA